MKELLKTELSKLSMAKYLRLYIPKFKSNLERSFWLDLYFREAAALNPGKDVAYLANELLTSPQVMRWLTEEDINKAVEWTEYCAAHNH